VEPTQRRLTHDPFNKTFEVVFSRSQQALIAKAWAATGNGGTEGGGRATSAGGGECATAPPSPAQPVPPAYDCNVLHLHLGTDQWATRPTTSPVTGGQQTTPSSVTGGRPSKSGHPSGQPGATQPQREYPQGVERGTTASVHAPTRASAAAAPRPAGTAPTRQNQVHALPPYASPLMDVKCRDEDDEAGEGASTVSECPGSHA
jgi:hypothetical protein